MKIAVYPGTFDPLTNGHREIIKRITKQFDKVIISIAVDSNKYPLFSVEQRLHLTTLALADIDNIEVVSFDGLLVDHCKQQEASVVIRGLRNSSDYEYESQLALMNRHLDKEIETYFLVANPEYAYLSSSLVKEVVKLGGDIEKMVHPVILDALIKEYN